MACTSAWLACSSDGDGAVRDGDGAVRDGGAKPSTAAQSSARIAMRPIVFIARVAEVGGARIAQHNLAYAELELVAKVDGEGKERRCGNS